VRWLVLLLVATSTIAWAEPKVAVAPLDNDDGGRIGDVVADAVGDRAKVTKQGRVEGAMRSMGVGILSKKSLKKLRTKLDVDVVIYGSVEKDGGEKRLALSLSGSGKSKLEVRYKGAGDLRKELAAKLPKKIAAAMQGDDSDEEDEDDVRMRREEDERRKKADEARAEREREEEAQAKRDAERAKREEDDRKKREDDERRAERKRNDDEDDGRKKRRGDREEEEEEDDRRDRKKKRTAQREEEDEQRTDEVDEEEEDRPRKKKKREKRHVLTQNAVWLDAGMAFARRTLTYQATGMMQPPSVGTAAPAARIEGEVYPGALLPKAGAAAGIGLVGAYSRTFALGIAVPGTQIVAPIKSGHYAIGARYRFMFAEHSVAVGVSYWRSHYIANRTGLMNPDQLDMPDVDYKAIAPGIAARVGITPIVAAFTTIDLPLMLKSGPIQEPTSYGSSKILAFDVRAGAQVVLASHVALQIGLDFEQVRLTFTGQAGSKAVTRMVSKATDRSVGIGATLGITY
jgi:actin-related protein